MDPHRLPDPDEDPADGGPLSRDDRSQRIDLHRTSALTDPLGHGTHVAGIIAGRASHTVTNVVLERQDRIVAGDAADSSYSVLTGDYETAARWESTPIEVGRPIAPPTPVFTKLDPSIVDEELARLEGPTE